MKTLMSNFSGSLLSKEQMRKVRGGYSNCTTSQGQPFASIDDKDAKTTVLLICGPCQYTCHAA
jgi:hypothetical protein